MAFLSSETFSCGGSFHSGHHEQMPGHLMKVSGPKEHLSVTALISSQGLTSSCRSEVEGKVFFSPPHSHFVNVTRVIWNVRTTTFSPPSKKKKETRRLDDDVIHEQAAEIVASAGRNLTNVSQSGKSASTNNLMEHYLPRTVCFCT